MVAQYQQFVDGVMARAELGSAEQAREMTIGVVTEIARRLPADEREQLADVLPGKVRDAVEWQSQAPGNAGTLLDDVGERTGRPAEQARYLVKGVLSELSAEEPSVIERLWQQLPQEFDALFEAPGGGPPPEWQAAVPEQRPRPLDNQELDRALAELEDWSGDTERITRTVGLPSDRWRPLLRRVEAIEHELSHHAHVNRGNQGALTFSVRTRSIDAVTELDLQLARRIDQAVNQVSSGG